MIGLLPLYDQITRTISGKLKYQYQQSGLWFKDNGKKFVVAMFYQGDQYTVGAQSCRSRQDIEVVLNTIVCVNITHIIGPVSRKGKAYHKIPDLWDVSKVLAK
jgi:hypothetical protein